MKKIKKVTEWNEELGSFMLKKEYKNCYRIDLINYIGELEKMLVYNAGSSIQQTQDKMEQLQESIFGEKQHECKSCEYCNDSKTWGYCANCKYNEIAVVDTWEKWARKPEEKL